ncbi:MAG: cysteine desulfurase [Ruminococcus sp.]|jgi:cysteine desulfurase|nr:cysteine desulfurase [Ruminococcus sp.]
MIYLDHAATTAPEPSVIDAVTDCMRNLTANPSASYSVSGPCRKKINDVKQIIAETIGAKPQEIFFTSGGSESNNWALKQAAGKHVIIGASEHKSVLTAAKIMGCEISLVRPERNGVISPNLLLKAIRPDTKLISIQFVNNETGAIGPITKIGEIATEMKVPFHCDAVAGYGHVPISVSESHISYLSVSAHKLYGPRGIGFLYIKQGIATTPLISGGDQENGRRGGTENLPGICGLCEAVKLSFTDQEAEINRLWALRKRFLSILAVKAPRIRETITGDLIYPGIISLILPGFASEKMITLLDMKGIFVSGGAACNSTSHSPSHVLVSMGLTPKEANEVIRVSMGRNTTQIEIETAAEAIAGLYSNPTI